MKNIIIRSLAIALSGICLCALPLSADNNKRNGGRHGGASKEAPASRGGNHSRPGASNRGSGSSRPQQPSFSGQSNKNHGNKNHGQQPNRPTPGHSNQGKDKHDNYKGDGHRPQGPRPGLGSQPAPGRPGNNGNHGMKPGNRPGHNNGHHGFRPNPGHMPHYKPPRPYYYRPQPPHRPHGWKHHPHAPRIANVFGLSFGTAINVSLNFLMNKGYTIGGYDNSQVWLRNVSMANYVWPDAALYYGNSGLDASSFYYTTSFYDPTRYNAVYAQMLNLYGAPVNYSTTHGAMSATWFGSSGYVTLTLGATTAGNYVTTLSFGL